MHDQRRTEEWDVSIRRPDGETVHFKAEDLPVEEEVEHGTLLVELCGDDPQDHERYTVVSQLPDGRYVGSLFTPRQDPA